MNWFVEKCNHKPSIAVKAMIEGMDRAKIVEEDADTHKDLLINMDSFGHVDLDGYCCGCAAVVSVMVLADISPLAAVAAHYEGIENKSISRVQCRLFEEHIDLLRKGRSFPLLRLFGLERHFAFFISNRLRLPRLLRGNQWKTMREDYVNFQKYLEAFNL